MKKRKIFGGVVLGFSVFLILFMTSRIASRSSGTETFGSDYFDGKFPDNQITYLSRSTDERARDLDKLVILYNPECDACYAELKQISTNAKLLDDLNVYLITTASKDIIDPYLENFDLSEIKYLSSGILRAESLGKFIIPYPTTLIYTREGFFYKGFKGSIDLANLKSRRDVH
jgi:thiol-disulfide isomerase/thioredoxin